MEAPGSHPGVPAVPSPEAAFPGSGGLPHSRESRIILVVLHGHLLELGAALSHEPGQLFHHLPCLRVLWGQNFKGAVSTWGSTCPTNGKQGITAGKHGAEHSGVRGERG